MGHVNGKTIGLNAAKALTGSKFRSVDNPRKSFLNLLFPKVCIGCKRFGYEICPSCAQHLTECENDFPLCIVCENLCSSGETHKFCRRYSHISNFTYTYSYQGIAKRILRQKSSRPEQIKVLLRPVTMHSKPDLIIPIPPSPKHLKPRIAEPVDVIAEYISVVLNIPIYKALYKAPFSKQQKRLSASARQKPSIYLKKESIPIIRNKHILLIDDVCTTGATLNTSAKLLKNFHANKVTAYALARDLRYN